MGQTPPPVGHCVMEARVFFVMLAYDIHESEMNCVEELLSR